MKQINGVDQQRVLRYSGGKNSTESRELEGTRRIVTDNSDVSLSPVFLILISVHCVRNSQVVTTLKCARKLTKCSNVHTFSFCHICKQMFWILMSLLYFWEVSACCFVGRVHQGRDWWQRCCAVVECLPKREKIINSNHNEYSTPRLNRNLDFPSVVWDLLSPMQ